MTDTKSLNRKSRVIIVNSHSNILPLIAILFSSLSLIYLAIYSHFDIGLSQQLSTVGESQDGRCPFDIDKPLLNQSLWIQNRLNAVKMTNELGGRAAVVIAGRDSSVNNDGVDFKQDSDFYYLSGINYPSSALILILNGSSTIEKSILLLGQRDIAFEGAYPIDSIVEETGVDEIQVVPLKDRSIPSKCIEKYKVEKVFLGRGTKLVQDAPDNIKTDSYRLAQALFHNRRVKSDKEIELITYATKVASLSHLNYMKQIKNGFQSEYSLLSKFKYDTFICGCRIQAYDPIVAANDHAAILHFQGMDEKVGNKKLGGTGFLLVDASGSYLNYASDVTRTIPLSLKFSFIEKKIYETVLEANKKAISAIKPGIRWMHLNQVAEEVILQGLYEIGIIKSDNSFEQDLQFFKSISIVKAFMPHGLGHTVGLDVHDSQPTPFEMILQERDVITIEPGIYFNADVLQRYRNSQFETNNAINVSKYINWELVDYLIETEIGGVRIEDVILVTQNGYKVLSNDAPKEISDIERVLNN